MLNNSLKIMYFAFILFVLHVAVEGVTLQAGAHLDLNVVVMVQKSFTGDGCRDMDHIDNDCLRRKCAQSTQYKVDLGYSNVRRNVDGMPLKHQLEGADNFLQSKNRLSLELARKVALLNNDAFQPFLYTEFERLITSFYDGHGRILALFNFSMEQLVNERLLPNNWTQIGQSPCDQLPLFKEVQQELVAILADSWAINWTRQGENVTDYSFVELIKHRLPLSPIQLIECYTIPERKQALNTNQLFRLLVRLVNMSMPFRTGQLDANCRALLTDVDTIIKTEPLVSRLHYSPARSLFVRDLESVLSTKAARGQVGRYFENNHATIRFHFLSMTAIRMEESREYNNFNLLVDLGSTLGLYFGLTILTLFELLIFVLYRAGSRDPMELQKLPSQTVIYNIPAGKRSRSNSQGIKLRQRRTKKEKEAIDQEYVIPIIF